MLNEDSYNETQRKIIYFAPKQSTDLVYVELISLLQVNISVVHDLTSLQKELACTSFVQLLAIVNFNDLVDENENVIQCFRLTSQEHRIPIIGITKDASNQNKLRLLSMDLDDVIVYPFNTKKITFIKKRWISPYFDQPEKDEYKEKKTAPQNYYTARKKAINIQQALDFSRNDPKLAQTLLKELIKMCQEFIQCSADDIKDENWPKLQELAHQLKGGSCYCGTTDLYHQASNFEKLLMNKQYDQAKTTYHELMQSIKALILWEEEHDLSVLFTEE